MFVLSDAFCASTRARSVERDSTGIPLMQTVYESKFGDDACMPAGIDSVRWRPIQTHCGDYVRRCAEP